MVSSTTSGLEPWWNRRITDLVTIASITGSCNAFALIDFRERMWGHHQAHAARRLLHPMYLYSWRNILQDYDFSGLSLIKPESTFLTTITEIELQRSQSGQKTWWGLGERRRMDGPTLATSAVCCCSTNWIPDALISRGFLGAVYRGTCSRVYRCCMLVWFLPVCL